MKLLYCGYNGFNQANDTELGNAVTKPTVIFENECDDSDVELYLGWSFFIILTGPLDLLFKNLVVPLSVKCIDYLICF